MKMATTQVVKFIGKTTWLQGKRLFDILARLKNFGVGRVVYRNVFHERYKPAPSFYVITKVDPDMTDPNEAEIDARGKSIAWGKKVFRGVDYGEQIITRCHKDDWRLVHREDEQKFLSYKTTAPEPELPDRPKSGVPTEIPFPPLFEHLLLEEKRRIGQPITADQRPMLKLKTFSMVRAMTAEQRAKETTTLEAKKFEKINTRDIMKQQ